MIGYDNRSSQRSSPDVSFIMPCFNEEQMVAFTIPRLVSAFERAGFQLELVAVDNGSSDRTGEVLHAIAERYPGIVHHRVEINEGYGNGVLKSIHLCTAPWIGIIPAEPTFGQEHGHVRSCCAEAAVARVEEHMGKPWLERQRGDGAAVISDSSGVIDCAEFRQPTTRFVEPGAWRWVEEWQAGRVGLTPDQGGKKQARQVGFEDFRRVMRRKRRICRLFP